MTAIETDSAMSKENPIKLEPINENSPSTNITTPSNPGIHNQPKTQDFENYNKSPEGKPNDSKGTSKRKHIIIITLMICTFVGSATGLILLYSHLNQIDAREAAIESGFQYPPAKTHEMTMAERYRTQTSESIRNCFDVNEYFSETTTERKCTYLDNVWTCVMDECEIQRGQNCSELLEVLIHLTPGVDTVFMAEAYLQVDIRQCSFYNETAMDILRRRGQNVQTVQ
ncbi:uncharacterized protein LOC110448672 [Mizuhopecten yessoensis]|nr:uncharacterized protein LOC110448672 [Mizuhopecten yessoensis]